MRPIAIQREFRELSNLATAEKMQRFFKTGKGEYGEGDELLGIRVPTIRAFAKRLRKQPMDAVLRILSSKYHEESWGLPVQW